MGNLFFSILGFSILFSFQTVAQSPQPLDKKNKEEVKKPEVALERMTKIKSQKHFLDFLQGHLSSQDFQELKQISDRLKVVDEGPLNFKITGRNKFIFGPQKSQFIFSHSGRHLRYKKVIFQLDKGKSLMWNYQNIVSQLKQSKYSQLWQLFFSKAYAEGDDFSQSGYDILTLLYYMKVYQDGK